MKNAEPGPAIYEVRVIRESGDPDVLYLCFPCSKSTSDYLRVVSMRGCSGRCERCGR